MATREISPDHNESIRKAMAAANVKHWELANILGISRTTLQDRLRYVISDEDKQTYLNAIDSIKTSRNAL